jgi:hypothetical protein
MTDLVIHPTTQIILNNLVRELPQSLLLSGEPGVGLLTTAAWLAGKSIAGELHPKDTKGNIDDEGGTITVEMIRRLYEQTRAKYQVRQVIIIDNADRMSRGAQSAFLKLLEEPNEYIYFILTSHQPQTLLPTIRSRVQQTIVNPITSEQTISFIKSFGLNNSVKQSQLQFIAQGRPAILTRLILDEEYFEERAQIISDARDFLQGNAYKKLLIIQKYKIDRTKAIQLIDSTLHILRRSLSAKPQRSLIVQIDQLLDVKERVISNHNIPLQLAQFVL